MKKYITSAILIIAVIFTFSSCKSQPDEEPSTQAEIVSEITVPHIPEVMGISVSSALSLENGVAGIVVVNNALKTLQYAEIKASFPGGIEHLYKVTTLPPGESCIVAEENGALYLDNNAGFFGYDISKEAYFTEEPTVHSDKFEFSGADGIINIKNVSGKDISENIVVYFKDYKDAQFTSGKTYRVTFEDGLAKDEIKQMPAGHYKNGESIIMFVQIVSSEVS